MNFHYFFFVTFRLHVSLIIHYYLSNLCLNNLFIVHDRPDRAIVECSLAFLVSVLLISQYCQQYSKPHFDMLFFLHNCFMYSCFSNSESNSDQSYISNFELSLFSFVRNQNAGSLQRDGQADARSNRHIAHLMSGQAGEQFHSLNVYMYSFHKLCTTLFTSRDD